MTGPASSSPLKRHTIKQTVTELPLADCLREVEWLRSLAEAGRTNGFAPSRPLEDVLHVVKTAYIQGSPGAGAWHSGSVEHIIRQYGLDQLDLYQVQIWDSAKEKALTERLLDHLAYLDLQRPSKTTSLGMSPAPLSGRDHRSDSTSPYADRNKTPTPTWAFASRGLKESANDLEDHLNLDSQDRFYGYLIKLAMPQRSEDVRNIEAIAESLRQGISSQKTDRPGPRAALVEKLAGRFTEVFSKVDWKEKDVEHAFVALLNGVLAQVSGKVASSLQSRAKAKEATALYLVVGHKALRSSNVPGGDRHSEEDKPDIVCLDELRCTTKTPAQVPRSIVGRGQETCVAGAGTSGLPPASALRFSLGDPESDLWPAIRLHPVWPDAAIMGL